MTEQQIVTALIEQRINAGLTMSEVARRMKTTHSIVSDLEHGKHGFTLGRMVQYAEAVGVSLTVKFE